MWVNINFERRDLTSAQKSHLSTDNFGETFAFNLIKQNVTYFSFMFLTQNFFCVPENLNLNYYCQVLLVSPHRLNGGLSRKWCSLVPHSPSVSSPPWYAALRNSHLQKHIIPGWIGIETLFSAFQCLYVVRFERDIVLSSSYDGWNKVGYTTWCPRGGKVLLLF